MRTPPHFIIDLLGIPPAVEIKIGSYAGSRFTGGIRALIDTAILQADTKVFANLSNLFKNSDHFFRFGCLNLSFRPIARSIQPIVNDMT